MSTSGAQRSFRLKGQAAWQQGGVRAPGWIRGGRPARPPPRQALVSTSLVPPSAVPPTKTTAHRRFFGKEIHDMHIMRVCYRKIENRNVRRRVHTDVVSCRIISYRVVP